jgi:bifunctional non-homologous end joining protein LigD
VILDGELVHLAADGGPDFAAVRRRLTASDAAAAARASARRPATLILFDVLHLDGVVARALASRERRALLADLLTEGPHCRIPPSWTERLDDVVAVTREHQLEGVVYKRRDSVYRPGRRASAWRKLKHRRNEMLTIAAPDEREPDTFYLTRPLADGEPPFAGTVQLGLDGERRERLRLAVGERELPAPRRRRIRPVAPGVSLIVSVGGPLRDAVIRELRIDPARAEACRGVRRGPAGLRSRRRARPGDS